LNSLYYAQRASAGLIIAEATQVSPEAQGYISTPGIHTAEQVEGWKGVSTAVHCAGGHIFLQLWHVGRISHPSFQPNGAPPVAPSAIKAEGQTYTAEGFQPLVTPRALEPARFRAESPISVRRPLMLCRRASTVLKYMGRTVI
jgi:N-ethylmaleimide reductase